MKVMIEDKIRVSSGLSSVFKAIGYEVFDWDKTTKPVFDAFDEFEPDVFIGDVWYGARDLHKCCSDRSHDLKVISTRTIQEAADTFVYKKGKIRPELACKISCLAEFSKEVFDELVKPVLDLNIDTKIVGNTRWEIPQYLGSIQKSTLCDLYVSSDLSLAINKSNEYYGIVLSHGLPICHPDETKWLLGKNNDSERKHFKKIIIQKTFASNTYWHRVAIIIKECLNLPDEAERTMKLYHETVKF